MARTTVDTYRSAFSEYQTVRRIGEGGSGIVYEVIDPDSRRFALKAVTPEKATKQRLKRFQNEIRFCQRTDHKNIVRVLDTGRSLLGSPFYVMELYPCTLEEQLGRLKPAEVLQVFSEILNGTEAAHLQNVTHRDLKPRNIMCNPQGGLYVIADFGIASFAEDELYTLVETRPDQRLANFQYAAPEQRTPGRAVDSKADIYALGLILNQMFTGQIPIGTEFTKIGSIAPEFSYLDPLVEEMIRQDPTRRPSIADIKSQLIARQQQFISLQKVHELTKQVVPQGAVDDPLVIDPIRPTNFDYEDGHLLITLSRFPNPEWIRLFQSQATQQFLNMGPERTTFQGAHAVVPVRIEIVVQQKKYVEGWIRNANGLYEEFVKHRIETQSREKEETLRRELQKERDRQEVLKLLSES
jgi:serine/threonine protein kinase